MIHLRRNEEHTHTNTLTIDNSKTQKAHWRFVLQLFFLLFFLSSSVFFFFLFFLLLLLVLFLSLSISLVLFLLRQSPKVLLFPSRGPQFFLLLWVVLVLHKQSKSGRNSFSGLSVSRGAVLQKMSEHVVYTSEFAVHHLSSSFSRLRQIFPQFPKSSGIMLLYSNVSSKCIVVFGRKIGLHSGHSANEYNSHMSNIKCLVLPRSIACS